MTLPNYLRTGRKKSVTSGVPVTPADTFTANSCAVYSYLLYDKTQTLKGRNCKCMKIYKKRIVILVCSSMAGSEKYPLHFVGKRTHSLNFSNTRFLPGTYHHIETPWVICKVALNLHSLSLSLSTDIWHQWRGQYCICWSVPDKPKIEEICKMS